MAMTLQEISDRLEIQDLLVRYCTAVDARDFDALDDIFTPDAIIDYRAMGGARGGLPEIKAFLRSALVRFASFQHMIGNSAVVLDGDTASGRTMCHNPMALDRGNGQTHVFFCGLWYVDELVRTRGGWRIARRTEERAYFHNLPEGFRLPE